MLDHVFTDAIGALRDAMEQAFLERQAFEERFQADVLLGDLTWETSYSLPGEGLPPRTRADISLDWPTWAQSAYRSWYIGEPFDEPPRIEIEIVMRVQRLAKAPDPAAVVAVLPAAQLAHRRGAAGPLAPDGRDDPRRGPLRARVRGRGELRGQLRAVRGGARRRLRPRRPLRRDGRLDRVDARAPRRPQVRVPGRRGRRRHLSSRQPAPARATGADATRIVFSVLVVVAFPIILRIGAYQWFLRDEWSFLSGRSITSVDDLFRPHALTHWSTVPIIAYRVLWFDLRRTHLPAVQGVRRRAAPRRRGAPAPADAPGRRATRGWQRSAAAPFILFGPGDQNIVWAFQIGFTGSIAFGLTQLLLATHDGPIDRRDWLGLGAGLLALMCSGVGVTMAVTVGVATLLLRGWRIAAFHTVPLAAAYGLWTLIEHPVTGAQGFGRPPLRRPGRMGRQLRAGHVRGARATTRWSPC